MTIPLRISLSVIMLCFSRRVLSWTGNAPYGPYGTNSDRETYTGCNYTRHAEVDAICKLPPHDKKNKSKRKITCDLLVVRFNKKGELRNSKPCFMCIKHLYRIKGYTIKRIYYSNDYGEIERHKFSDLYREDTKHVSKRFR